MRMILKNYVPHLLIALLVILVCWPSLSGNFIFDDNSLIKNNPYVTSSHSLSSYLAQEDGLVDKADMNHFHTGFYRPLLNFSYFIDYKIWGMKAFGFRLTNIFLHLICCLLIFQLLICLKIDRLAALFGTIFFAIHPTNTESVSMIVCRNNLLVTIFSILSLIFYIESRRDRRLFLFISALFFCFALLSKEVAVMMIPIFFLYNKSIDADNRGLSKEIVSYLPFLFLMTFYLILRSQVIGAFSSPIASENFLTRLYFIPYIIASNFLLVFFPFGLHSFYVPYPEFYFGYKIVISYIFLLLLVIVMWKLQNKKLLIFSIAAFIISMFPVMNLIPIASPSIIAMRWLYFPLAFLAIAVAYLFQTAMALGGKRFIALSVISIIFVYLGTYAYVLNDTLWKDQRSFLNIEVLHFKNVLFAATLAEALHGENKYNEAKSLYVIALDAFPNKAETYINYSALLIDTGRTEDAKKYLTKAKSLLMTSFERCEWFNNMGVACLHQKQTQCAQENLNQAVKYCPDNPVFKKNLQIVKLSHY
jgi:tetratricopeptide (TPR) repeat protein